MNFQNKFAMAKLMGGLGRGLGAAGRVGAGAGRMGMGAARAIGPRGLAIGGGLGGLGAGGMWLANAMGKKPTGPAGLFQNRNQELESIYQTMPPGVRTSSSLVVRMAQSLIS